MYPANITRAETMTRAGLIATRTYELLVDLTGLDPEAAPLPEPAETFVTTSRIRFSSQAGITYVDVIADRIVNATLDGKTVDTTLFDGTRLPIDLTEGRHELVITAVHRYSRNGQGLHRFVDPADGRTYLYTQFEPADARRVFANFEQPDLKARYTITVLAPSSWIVASNAERVTPTPVDAQNSRWEFRPTQPISTYLTALIAGDYHEVVGTIRTTTRGEIPANLYCRTSLAPHLDIDRIMATVQDGFEVFEGHFGTPFPFDSYDQAFVPEYNAGAMENAGLVTFRDDLIFRSRATEAQYDNRDNTILHELAHMWFGNLVTMRWWDDLWLKESFAEWASHFAQSQIGTDPRRAWASFSNARKTWAYRADQLPSTHPIAADMVDLEAVELNFDGITYAKGASALRQLVAYVGQEPFLAGARRYFSTHAWMNTTLADLLRALTAASGRDLSQWSNQWLESAGVNTLRPVLTTDGDDIITDFRLVQTAPDDHPVLRQHRLAVGFFRSTDAGLERILRVETDIAGTETPIPELVGQPRPDLILVNDGDLTFAKIRMDERSRATMVSHIDRVDDALTRALLWGAAWDMCRDGELTVADYVTMVVRGVATETEQTAVSRVLGQAHVATTLFLPADQRRAQQTRFAEGLADLVREAAPGSDHQLAFARAMAQSADAGSGAGLLLGWLEGRGTPAGLEVDADLRWRLLTELARLGAIDDERIDAELGNDNTITGAEWAAAARASLATPEAKARAWQLATATPGVPNETHRQICTHFCQPGQEEQLAPYARRYLELAEEISGKQGVWRDHGVHLAQSALRYLFPSTVADADYLTLLDDWLGATDLQDSVRRVIGECRDDARRALTVQNANTGPTQGAR